MDVISIGCQINVLYRVLVEIQEYFFWSAQLGVHSSLCRVGEQETLIACNNHQSRGKKLIVGPSKHRNC